MNIYLYLLSSYSANICIVGVESPELLAERLINPQILSNRRRADKLTCAHTDNMKGKNKSKKRCFGWIRALWSNLSWSPPAILKYFEHGRRSPVLQYLVRQRAGTNTSGKYLSAPYLSLYGKIGIRMGLRKELELSVFLFCAFMWFLPAVSVCMYRLVFVCLTCCFYYCFWFLITLTFYYQTLSIRAAFLTFI